VELPHDVLHQIYKMINLEIIKTVKNNPELLKSIENPEIIDEYQNERNIKRKEFAEHMKYLNVTDDIKDFMREIYEEEYITYKMVIKWQTMKNVETTGAIAYR